MEPPQPAAAVSQASSHFQLEPIPASVLAEREACRRDAAAKLGACITGCAVLDEQVLLGGFERGTVVGISAEDEEMAVQLGLQTLAYSLCHGTVTTGLVVTPKPASVMLAGLRDAVKSELKTRGVQDGRAKARLRECLEKVMLSCVFDLDGLWEVLADLDTPGGSEAVDQQDEEPPEQEEKAGQEGERATIEVEEIQDSQDDDDDALSPIQSHSSPEQPQPQPHQESRPKQHQPGIILVTHFSSLLTSLFSHREKSAAHSALHLLSSHLRHLSRNLSSSPLIMLLNSTSSPALSSPTTTASSSAPTAASPAKQAPLDPTLRSIFNPPGYGTYSIRRTKPSFGLVFSQLLDLHLLCTHIPRTKSDAEAVVQRLVEDVRMAWVVEVLLDDLGVWEGTRGVRIEREQKWTAVGVEGGRIKAAFEGVETGEDKRFANTGEVRVVRGFGGPRV
ncbi:hypothetical protein FDECE_6896 [Fusarium decemcellulare]|nr:hypothetical protein FDECE_6896 [Fusarium decemcellulare]